MWRTRRRPVDNGLETDEAALRVPLDPERREIRNKSPDIYSEGWSAIGNRNHLLPLHTRHIYLTY